MSITILDKDLPMLLRLLHLGASQPENVRDPGMAYLCYRLGQRVDARLHAIGNPAHCGPLGPVWCVWITEPAVDPSLPIWTEWSIHEEFSFLNDADGTKAKAAAHKAARALRTTYHCSYVAVTPATRWPRPLKSFPC